MQETIDAVNACTYCAKVLTHTPRPVIRLHEESKILIIGQAPGLAVHKSGIPWDDKSGENLRSWLNVDPETFNDPKKIGILPMGFCYPGKGKSGDLPPRHECAPKWHNVLMEQFDDVQLVLLIGQYAQQYYIKEEKEKTLTETVKNFQSYLPQYFVLPHPSPRNNIWQAKNPWFKSTVIPTLQAKVQDILS